LEAVSSVIIGIISVLTRLTITFRDNFLERIGSKIFGKKKSSMDADRMNIASSNIYFLDSVVELSDIIVMSAFFSFLLLPNGPLKYMSTQNVKIDRTIIREIGFKIENKVAVNAVIQFFIEIGTQIVIAFLEHFLKRTKYILNDFIMLLLNKENTVYLIHVFFVYGFAYPLFFFSLLYFFPWMNTNIADNASGLDMDKTWVFSIPNIVEVSHVIEWLSNEGERLIMSNVNLDKKDPRNTHDYSEMLS